MKTVTFSYNVGFRLISRDWNRNTWPALGRDRLISFHLMKYECNSSSCSRTCLRNFSRASKTVFGLASVFCLVNPNYEITKFVVPPLQRKVLHKTTLFSFLECTVHAFS